MCVCRGKERHVYTGQSYSYMFYSFTLQWRQTQITTVKNSSAQIKHENVLKQYLWLICEPTVLNQSVLDRRDWKVTLRPVCVCWQIDSTQLSLFRFKWDCSSSIRSDKSRSHEPNSSQENSWIERNVLIDSHEGSVSLKTWMVNSVIITFLSNWNLYLISLSDTVSVRSQSSCVWHVRLSQEGLCF